MSFLSTTLAISLLIAASFFTLVAGDDDDDQETVWVTPHESYSSSVGVLGCKVNTNRVAYWPGAVDCDNICVSLSHGDRSVKLLRVDHSAGAHDVSYDAWNYLTTGESAQDNPTTGGAVEMQFRHVDASKCKSLIHTKGHKLPLSAPNSMNFLAACLDQPDSWVAENHVLFNIADPLCSMGYDEKCDLDWPDANQPSCEHTLGSQEPLTDAPVYNIQYGTGEEILANGQPGDAGGGDDGDSAASAISSPLPMVLTFFMAIMTAN